MSESQAEVLHGATFRDRDVGERYRYAVRDRDVLPGRAEGRAGI